MTGIEIEQTQTEEKPVIATENKQAENVNPETINEPQVDTDLDHELQVKLQPILLDSAINALGNTLAKITKLDDLDFTEDEHKALVEAWAPLLPSVSPMTNAILVTVIILSGKGLLYVASKKKVQAETKALPVNSTEIKEAVN